MGYDLEYFLPRQVLSKHLTKSDKYEKMEDLVMESDEEVAEESEEEEQESVHHDVNHEDEESEEDQRSESEAEDD